MSPHAISLPFTTLDVFTSTPYEGNPLAVVFLPAPTEFIPSQTQLQTIASEFNLSETIFLEHRTPEDLANNAQRARIFTTEREILFAGHPTIGAASWCLVHDPKLANSQPVSTLIPGAGPIPISLSPESASASANDRYVRARIPHNMRLHGKRISATEVLAVHPTVSAFISSVQHKTGFPVVSIVKGMTVVLVELASTEALAAAKLGEGVGISAKSVKDGGHLDEDWGYDAQVAVYFYIRAVVDTKIGTGQEVIRTRMMVRGIEDPATGSAASSLTTYLALAEMEEKGKERKWVIVQGVEMGRRSEIGVEVCLKEDGKSIKTVELGGCAVVICEGSMRV